jgi:hypothetical protein
VERFLNAKSTDEFVKLEDLDAAIAALPVSSADERAQQARILLSKAVQLKKARLDYSEARQRGDFDPEP